MRIEGALIVKKIVSLNIMKRASMTSSNKLLPTNVIMSCVLGMTSASQAFASMESVNPSISIPNIGPGIKPSPFV